MAAVCLDNQPSTFMTINNSTFVDAFPKIENHVGDIPYVLDESQLLLITYRKNYPDSCLIIKALTIVFIVILGAIVGVKGGQVMYYVPLYAALTPIVYWLLKIGYALYVVKSRKLSVDSKEFDGKAHG